MSLKSFHIVFIAASCLLSLTVGIWSFGPGAQHLGPTHLPFGVSSLLLGIASAVYGVYFIRKSKGLVVHATNRKSSYRVIPGGSGRPAR